jgi:hypothetical protein
MISFLLGVLVTYISTGTFLAILSWKADGPINTWADVKEFIFWPWSVYRVFKDYR